MILTKSSRYLNTVRAASRLQVERHRVRGGQELVGAGSGGPPVKLDSIAVTGDPCGALTDTHLHCVPRVLEPVQDCNLDFLCWVCTIVFYSLSTTADTVFKRLIYMYLP